jgi:ABC-type polar amino acid transport system, ATPase component
MIKIDNLKKSFADNIILNGISFEIKENEILAIIGPSGTGKSTLLRCMNYLEKPNSGKIEFDDLRIDFERINKKQISSLRKKSSMVFQNYNLFNNKTVLENVTEALIVTKKIPKVEAAEIAEEQLSEVGMWEKRNQYPITLSGGQQQRVGIARAMAVKPEIILFDEPTSSLDPTLVNEVLETIKTLTTKNITMAIVTHEMKFARNVANQVMFLADGEICEKGSPDEIFNHPQTEKLISFLKSANKY